MAGVNSEMDHELIEDKDMLVVEDYASCRGCNIIPQNGLLSDNKLCSSCACKQRQINRNKYLGLHLYDHDEKRCHACVTKSTQIGSGVEKFIYKSIGDTVEEHIVTGGDDQVNVEDFFENSEDEINSTLDNALKMHVQLYCIILLQ